jgi:hypothetical protein
MKEAFEDRASEVGCLVGVGDNGLAKRSVVEGKEAPDSRGGMSSSKLVGNRRIKASRPGLFAKRVIERRRGRTRSSHSVLKCIDLEAGRRV